MPVSNLPLPVISNLLSGPRFTETELLELNRVIIARIKILRRLTAAQIGASLSIGDNVTWSGRKGVYTGRVEKINRKNAKVKVGTAIWTVPMNMLALA
jgi:hypothetical protein